MIVEVVDQVESLSGWGPAALSTSAFSCTFSSWLLDLRIAGRLCFEKCVDLSSRCRPVGAGDVFWSGGVRRGYGYARPGARRAAGDATNMTVNGSSYLLSCGSEQLGDEASCPLGPARLNGLVRRRLA